ncbi:MAG TPA: hypothetical protein PLS50_09340, partial [Candidatus Dojkabacteria bacterium]|nr:hypothetical protein [Candidatus Dojkabacteria bacterium]
MSTYVQTNQMVYVPASTAPNTIYRVNAADSGKTLLIPSNGAVGNTLNINLPARAAGLKFKFMASDAVTAITTIRATTDGTTTINALFYGCFWNIPNGAHPSVARKVGVDTVQFNAAANVGDFIEVNCDGTYWYTLGQ